MQKSEKKHTGDGTINKINYRTGQLAGAYIKVTGPHGSIHVLITDTSADGEGYKVCLLDYIRYEPHGLNCASLHLVHTAVAKCEK